MKAWRDGGPPPDRDPDLAAHLGQCDACGAALEDLVGVSDEQTVARAFASIETRPGFAGRVLARLAGATEGQAPAAAPASIDDDDSDDELDELLAAGARFAGLGPAGRSGMGMVIEYCAVCRERIDAADFRSGVAIQFKGQSYCRACKVQVVEEFADDPEYQAQQRRAQQAHARPSDREESDVGSGIRPGMGRAVRREPAAARRGGAGGPNVMLLGGIAAGVLVLIVGAVFVFAGGDGTPGRGESTSTARGPTPRGGDPKRGGNSGKAPDSQGKKPGPSATPQPAPPSMEEQHRRQRAVQTLREKREDVAKFAKENEGPENWQDVDVRYRNFLEDSDWTAAADDPAVKELRAQVENDKKLAQQRFEDEGNTLISRAISRATSEATRGRFDPAMRALDDVPMIFSGLERWKELAETRAKIDEIAKKKMGVMGEWFDVVKGPGDVDQIRGPTGASGTTIIWDPEDQCVVVKTEAQSSSLVFTSQESEGWADYEVEFEAKATNNIQFGVRVTVNPESRRYQGDALKFDENDFAEYHKYLVKIEGQKLIVHVDGQEKINVASGWRRGKPMILMPPNAEFRVRGLRYKVLKVLGQ